ncbi:MAG: hypothetical protein JSW73_03585 [Candidatus Woesearchaeota archaeon]|nr:MAG: hypothetical protein JSW73_03585 [Candidatus Woesearchaeota archaeon]
MKKPALINLVKDEENLFKLIEKTISKEETEIFQTLKLIRNIKNRGFNILSQIKALEIAMYKKKCKVTAEKFLKHLREEVENLKKEAEHILEEEKEEAKLEKFIESLLERAEQEIEHAEKNIPLLK